jgi:3-phenylpropionate/trans-cinnamate dioxygenase ferredoxin reductase component
VIGELGATLHTDVLIVGAGEAGLGLAVELRLLGFGGRITVVGDEPFLPYQRPPLSKGFMDGTEDEDSLAVRAPEFLREHAIEVLQGRRVQSVDLADKGGAATLDDASVVRFDKLAFATGARARELPVPGTTLAGVHTLRTIEDAKRIRSTLAETARLVVVGGGFIGLEVAAASRRRGLAVTVLEATPRLLGRVCARPLSEFLMKEHSASGIDIRLDTTVVELLGDTNGHVTDVLLADGTTIPADMVIVGVGALPNVELAERAGLECRRGILVDAEARTSIDGVVAVGDCAEQPHPNLPGQRLTIESVNNALEQSKLAAHSLLGSEVPRRGVAWFWSDQADLKVQIAGIADGHDTYVTREDGDRLTVLYFQDRRLIAADVVNNPRDFMAVKRALGERRGVAPERAHDLRFSLKDLLQDET